MREQDFYIPPDVTVDEDGRISQEDWTKVLRLDNAHDQFVLSFTGMGMPPLEYVTQRGPNQHGEDLLSYRLQPRTIQYVYRYNGHCNRTNYWQARSNLVDYLRPNRHTANQRIAYGRLRKVWPDGTTRDIDALIDQGPIFSARNLGQWDEWSFTETLRFRCPETVWYDPDRQDVVWEAEIYAGLIFYDAANYPGHLVFPDNALFETDFIFSSSTSITYTGTWHSYPIIYITGPINNPIIRNTTFGMKIALDYEVANGEQIIINTEYGNKTIVNNASVNLIGALTNDSDLEFYLAPDPVAADGINTLSVVGSDALAGATEVRLTYHTRYIGI
jgi:hypothetical protein